MEKIFLSFKKIIVPALVAALFSGCVKDKITHTYQVRTPVYQVLSKFREQIKSMPASNIGSRGKMTVAGNYIFISELYKGIHVIDNSNPASPKNVSFINVPGNEDMSIVGNTLYADAYSDLVTFDITDPANAVAKNFAANVFPDHAIYYAGLYTSPDSINVVVDWIVHDTTVDYVPNQGGGIYFYPPGCPNCMTIAQNMNASTLPGAAGTNGSLSRFATVNNYLYTVSYSQLSSFDITNRLAPVYKTNFTVDWHVETIFPFKGRLFVGTNNGMYMYDAEASPSNPTPLGEFTHVRGCDPVVADDNYAYVTINDSSACLGFNNELQIINVQNFTNSFLVKSYQLTHPIGLSKDGNNLFICDGSDGLKIFNAADVNNLQLIKQIKDINAVDIITINGLAIVVATDGVYQYDYSDLNNIHPVSKL
ncbi:MAG TPA: hypothetical protein VKT28_18855 [Puia sp.]|nr:hypothetical protein [Puia sp.]